MLSNEKFKSHKIPYVLQYYVPNKETSPEEYAYHMLFMYYPFRDEKEVLSGIAAIHSAKVAEPGVTEILK